MNALEDLKNDYPQFSPMWDNLEETLSDKTEIIIRVTSPMRKIKDFVILRQISVQFRIDGEFSDSSLNLQKKFLLTSSETPIIENRLIWSRHNKYVFDETPNISTTDMRLINKLSSLFKFDSEDVFDLSYPNGLSQIK